MTNLTDTKNHTVYHGGVVNYGDREMKEFNIGDKVRVSNTDMFYSTYQKFADVVEAKNYIHNRYPSGNEFTISAISNHHKTRVKCYLLTNGEGDFIFDNGNDAFELIKKPKRTKIEYVKCYFSREWEAVKHYNEVGELFDIDCNGNHTNVNDISGAWYEVVCRNYDSLYRQVEVEIDWRDEVKSFLESCGKINGGSSLDEFTYKSNSDFEHINKSNDDYDNEFVRLCHLVADLTDKPEGE